MEHTEFNALQFCIDYNIDYALSGPNISSGNLGINCPFPHFGSRHISDNTHHGAFMGGGGAYYCWTCGGHKLIDVVKALVPEENPQYIINKYSNKVSYNNSQIIQKVIPKVDTVYFPGTTLSKRHREYLINKDYDPDYLMRKYRIKGVDNEDWYYKERIVAPVYFNNELVAIQGRSLYEKKKEHWYDIVWPYPDKPYRKYVNSVKPDNEKQVMKKYRSKYSLKDILYNLDNCKKDSVLVVEGIADVWRLGDNTCCSFGTKVKESQIRLLADRFKKVYVLFDNEEEAIEHAKKMCHRLMWYGIYTEHILFKGSDPGKMTEHTVFTLKKDLGLL